MNHLEVLDQIKTEYEKEDNVLALLIFGSVANGTFHENSDIDLSIVYKVFEPGFEFTKGTIDAIDVGYSRWSIDHLRTYVKKSPYRAYVFAHATAVFDKTNIKQIQQSLLDYFINHPGIEQEWIELSKVYQQEKRTHGKGQTDIFEIYKELEKRYAK